MEGEIEYCLSRGITSKSVDKVGEPLFINSLRLWSETVMEVYLVYESHELNLTRYRAMQNHPRSETKANYRNSTRMVIVNDLIQPVYAITQLTIVNESL